MNTHGIRANALFLFNAKENSSVKLNKAWLDVINELCDEADKVATLEGAVQEIEPIREAPEGSRFMTLLVAYLFEDDRQYRMFDGAETDMRHVVDGEHGGVIALLAWEKLTGFPIPQEFAKFQREVTEELGDIPFVEVRRPRTSVLDLEA